MLIARGGAADGAADARRGSRRGLLLGGMVKLWNLSNSF